MIQKVGVYPILHHQHTCCVNENGQVCRWGQSDYTPKWSPVVSPPFHVPRSNNHREISKAQHKNVLWMRSASEVIYQCSVCRWTSCFSGTQWLLVPKRIITQFLLTSNPACIMAPQKSSVIQGIYNFLAFIYRSVCLSVCLSWSVKEHINEFCWCSRFQWDFDFWSSQDHRHGALIIKPPPIVWL